VERHICGVLLCETLRLGHLVHRHCGRGCCPSLLQETSVRVPDGVRGQGVVQALVDQGRMDVSVRRRLLVASVLSLWVKFFGSALSKVNKWFDRGKGNGGVVLRGRCVVLSGEGVRVGFVVSGFRSVQKSFLFAACPVEIQGDRTSGDRNGGRRSSVMVTSCK